MNTITNESVLDVEKHKDNKPIIDLLSVKSVEEAIRGLQPIKQFPCIIQLYDRWFQVDDENELRLLQYGLEIGEYMTLDEIESEDE